MLHPLLFTNLQLYIVTEQDKALVNQCISLAGSQLGFELITNWVHGWKVAIAASTTNDVQLSLKKDLGATLKVAGFIKLVTIEFCRVDTATVEFCVAMLTTVEYVFNT